MEATTESTAQHRPGRPFGMANLSEKTKASIVVAKNLQVYSHQRIAQDHNVSRQTVVNTTYEKLSPEAKRQVELMTDKLGRVQHKIVDRIEQKLDDDSIKSGAYAQLLTAVHNAKRLEDGLSTSNVSLKADHVITNLTNQYEAAKAMHKGNPERFPEPDKTYFIERAREVLAANGLDSDIEIELE